MADFTYVDLLDEVNCADSCEVVLALCKLVDKLIADIQFLELECISTRHLLSEYMDEDRESFCEWISFRIWLQGIPEIQLMRCIKHSCTAEEIPWNFAIILSRCRPPAKVNGPTGIDIR